MADEAPDAAVLERQPTFHFQMLGILAVLLVITSLLEADRRGLLFDSDPFAFAVEDTAFVLDGPDDLAVGVIRLGSLDRFDRRGARRFIPRSGNRLIRTRQGGGTRPASPAGNRPGSQGSGTANAAPSNPLQSIPGSAGPGLGGPPLLAAANTPGSSVPGGGFTPGPTGLIPVGNNPPDPTPPDPTNPDPVVPAIPEPASWILMIIAIGWLGFVLRRRQYGENEQPILTGA